MELNANDSGWTGQYFSTLTNGIIGKYDNFSLTTGDDYHYIRGLNGEVLAVYDGNDNLVDESIYANNQRIGKLDAAGNRRVHLNDYLGSHRAQLTSSGSTPWRSSYYPFGSVAKTSGGDSQSRFGFTGHEMDYSTGLNYAIHRYYHSELGRWLSVDPLGDKYSGWSLYNYTLNNPIRLIDIDGRIPGDPGNYAASATTRSVGFVLRHPIAAFKIGKYTPGR